jgi:hypothetical protein
MSLQIPHREKQANGVQPVTKAVILVSRHVPSCTESSVPNLELTSPRSAVLPVELVSGRSLWMFPR